MEKNNYEIIQEWHALLKNGTITEEEFTAKKNQLLNVDKINREKIEQHAITHKVEFEKSKGFFDNSVLILVGFVCVVVLGVYLYTIKDEFKKSEYENETTIVENDTTSYQFDRTEDDNTTEYKNEPTVVKEDVVEVESNTVGSSDDAYDDSYDKPVSGNYIVNANENHLVYFYETPDLSTKKKAYFSTEDKVYISEFKNGFGFVEFVNSRGQKSVGWLQLSEISYCNDCN